MFVIPHNDNIWIIIASKVWMWSICADDIFVNNTFHSLPEFVLFILVPLLSIIKKIIATSYLRYLQKIRQWTLYQVDPITWKNRTLRQSPNGAERMWRQDFSPPAVIRTNKQLLEWRNMDDDPLISSSNISKARILTENDSVPGLKFKQDLENYMVSQLKRWLKCWGLRLSGKRTDLVARIRDCLKSGNFYVLDSSTDNGKWLEAKILKERESIKGIIMICFSYRIDFELFSCLLHFWFVW